MKTRKQNLDTDIAFHNIKRSHGIGQSRQPGKKPCPVIAKIVQYNNRNKIFRNKKKNFKVKKKINIQKCYSKQNGKIESTGATWFWQCLDQQW